jgi:hypothetical protein
MAEFNVRADAVDVEQIMGQIRARIREKRGVDYTEEQIQELARIRLEKFLDPKGVRSDLLEQFRRTAHVDMPATYDFGEETLYASDKALVRFFRRLLRPLLKLFFNPNPLIQVLHQQAQINRYLLDRVARDVMFYEVVHNLVLEMTRTGIDVRNMQMRVESVSGRLDFNERRARALEAVVQYKPETRERGDRGTSRGPESGGSGEAAGPSGVDPITGGESLRSRRRRRRRGRRSGSGFGGDQAGAFEGGRDSATEGEPADEDIGGFDQTDEAPDQQQAATADRPHEPGGGALESHAAADSPSPADASGDDTDPDRS